MKNIFLSSILFLCFFSTSNLLAQDCPETDLAGVREELIEIRKKLLDAQEQKLNLYNEKLNRKKTFLFNIGEMMQYYDAKFLVTVLYVDIATQQLLMVSGESILKSYSISTSKYGSGFDNNSFKTPLGLHKIKNKFGEGQKRGTVFYDRLPTKDIAKIYTDSTDLATYFITTRILWLDGQEHKINKGMPRDSYERFIYIHGTHEEGLIGKPASMGCVRMRNDDIVELYSKVHEGTFVIIVEKL
jgi:hypothetical protein